MTSTAPRILVVDDDPEIRKLLARYVEGQGFRVLLAASCRELRDQLAAHHVDLVVLDVMLPDGDGRDFLRRHRAGKGVTPIIVLTARSQVSDRISLLDLGADDYVTKPFDHAELEARCRAVLRRNAGSAQTVVRMGDVAFDPVAGVLTVGETLVSLRNKELRLLEVLFNAPGQIFPKQKLVDRLFSYDDDVSENAIEVYIGRLRKHLEGSQLQISTHRGLGYRLDHD